MGKPVTLLEELCRHAHSFGASWIQMESHRTKDLVFTLIDGTRTQIFAASGSEAKELRATIEAAARKPIRTPISGQIHILKVRTLETAREITIEPAPMLDPALRPPFTPKQGQYLAYIHAYSKMHGVAPSEVDLQHHFRVSAPSVHEMVKTLERNGLIARTPGQARSIRLLVRPDHLPRLKKCATP
jgi:DNA-binding MarR family transcriptional regulator